MVALIVALIEHRKQATDVRRCLEAAGHQVRVVDSFARAVAILQEHSFDLIISDVHLENGGSVFDFLKWVKGHRRFRTIPFVLFSMEPSHLAKYLADGVQTAARKLGASKYIVMEQFNPVLLVAEIAELLPAGPVVEVVTKEGD